MAIIPCDSWKYEFNKCDDSFSSLEFSIHKKIYHRNDSDYGEVELLLGVRMTMHRCLVSIRHSQYNLACIEWKKYLNEWINRIIANLTISPITQKAYNKKRDALFPPFTIHTDIASSSSRVYTIYSAIFILSALHHVMCMCVCVLGVCGKFCKRAEQLKIKVFTYLFRHFSKHVHIVQLEFQRRVVCLHHCMLLTLGLCTMPLLVVIHT